MTRGFFILAEKSKIIDVAYFDSSAYPSYEGVNILEALTSGEDAAQAAEKYISELTRQYGSTWDGFSLDWDTILEAMKRAGTACITKAVDVEINGATVSACGVEDYTYVFKKGQDSLTVYQNGKKLITVPHEAFATMKDVFSEWEYFKTVFSIDEQSLMLAQQKQALSSLEALISEGAEIGEIDLIASQRPQIYIDTPYSGEKKVRRVMDVYCARKNDDRKCWFPAFSMIAENYYPTTPTMYRLSFHMPHMTTSQSTRPYSIRQAETYLADKLKAYLPDSDSFCELMLASRRIKQTISDMTRSISNGKYEQRQESLWASLSGDAERIKQCCDGLAHLGTVIPNLDKASVFNGFSQELMKLSQSNECNDKIVNSIVSHNPFKLAGQPTNGGSTTANA